MSSRANLPTPLTQLGGLALFFFLTLLQNAMQLPHCHEHTHASGQNEIFRERSKKQLLHKRCRAAQRDDPEEEDVPNLNQVKF